MKPLSQKELACLQWASVGKTSWEVGKILGVSERTVNFHIQTACRKLGVHRRQAAITALLQAGLLHTASPSIQPALCHAETHLPQPAEMTTPAP
ncbi:helix-turn-helix domain-containing protein [Alcaligenaceae bacterium]|nr:helix-turn-helix domain-containing protein [Alcaligenaceae bacterium]